VAFNRMVREKDVPAVAVKEKKGQGAQGDGAGR